MCNSVAHVLKQLIKKDWHFYGAASPHPLCLQSQKKKMKGRKWPINMQLSFEDR